MTDKPPATLISSIFHGRAEGHKKILLTIKAQADAKRTFVERLADEMTGRFGSIAFLLFNVGVFVVWLHVNTNQLEAISAFDPFPFNLLTTVVSLEAIILAIFVLISQNRDRKVGDLREEVDLQINLISEKEIIKVMQMLELLLEKNGINLSKDPELQQMLKPISEEEIERRLEKEIL